MRRKETISRLKGAERAIRALGAVHVYLFGSAARDEAGPSSDVDIFIDRDPEKTMGLPDLVALQRVMKDILGRKVDLGTRGGLHPSIKHDVERNAIKVF